MAFGAHLGVTHLLADTQTWLANYIDVAQTLNIASYAVTIIGGIIVGYIAYRIVAEMISTLFQSSITNAMQTQMKTQINNRQNRHF